MKDSRFGIYAYPYHGVSFELRDVIMRRKIGV